MSYPKPSKISNSYTSLIKADSLDATNNGAVGWSIFSELDSSLELQLDSEHAVNNENCIKFTHTAGNASAADSQIEVRRQLETSFDLTNAKSIGIKVFIEGNEGEENEKLDFIGYNGLEFRLNTLNGGTSFGANYRLFRLGRGYSWTNSSNRKLGHQWLNIYLDEHISEFGGFDIANVDGVTLSLSSSLTHSGTANQQVLTDDSQNWKIDELVGLTLVNATDGSTRLVTSNTPNTVTSTIVTSGTGDDWDNGDDYYFLDAEGEAVPSQIRSLTMHIEEIVVDPKNTNLKPKIAITFDDAIDSDYSIAFAKMAPLGIKGGSNLIYDRVTNPRSAGKITLDELKEMHDSGLWAAQYHFIANHDNFIFIDNTLSETHQQDVKFQAANLVSPQTRKDAMAGWFRWCEDNGFTQGIRTGAYPQSQHNLQIRQELFDGGFTSFRAGLGKGDMSNNGSHSPLLTTNTYGIDDPMRLISYKYNPDSYADTTWDPANPDAITTQFQDMLTDAVETGTDMIIAYHLIKDNPTAANNIDVPTARFNAHMDLLKSYSDQGLIDIAWQHEIVNGKTTNLVDHKLSSTNPNEFSVSNLELEGQPTRTFTSGLWVSEHNPTLHVVISSATIHNGVCRITGVADGSYETVEGTLTLINGKEVLVFNNVTL